jgi:hypothetical protein
LRRFLPRRLHRRSLALAAAVAVAAIPGRADPGTITMTVDSRVIENFRIGSGETRFGELEFVGGLEMYGSSKHFGALSAIHVFDDQAHFIGAADTGFWYGGRIERDADRRPTGLTDVTMREFVDAQGGFTHEKWNVDAEGLTVDGQTAYVSFEREHRITEYDISDLGNPVFLREAKPPVPMYELRRNRGFETVAVAPQGLPYAGALVGITEKSLDRDRNIMAFVRKPDGASFEFSVRRRGEFDITDGKFLPDGDLVLLERRFNIQDGVAMRLRRIAGTDIIKGSTVDGEILLQADLLYQIDNMEGLSVSVDPDGTPRLTIVSDDNHSILQRNLLLEFRLVGRSRQAMQDG